MTASSSSCKAVESSVADSGAMDHFDPSVAHGIGRCLDAGPAAALSTENIADHRIVDEKVGKVVEFALALIPQATTGT